MAIIGKKLITIEEFKASEIFDATLGKENNVQYNDHYLNEAIGIASNNIDYLTSFQLFGKINNNELSDSDLNDIKYVCCKYVLHLIRKGLEYARGQDSMSLGSISWSTSNPDDPYYLIPDVKIVLERLGLLNNFYIASMETPANYNNYRNPLPYDIDGNGKITRRDADSLYIGWDKVISTNGTINIKVDVGNQTNKIIDLQVNILAIIANFYQNPVFVQMVKTTFNENIEVVESELIDSILANETYKTQIEQAIVKVLDNDDDFKTTLEKALDRLLEVDSKFIENVALNAELQAQLKTDISKDANFKKVIASEVEKLLEANTDFINTIATNTSLVNKVVESVGKKVSDLVESTFNELLATKKIDWLDGVSLKTYMTKDYTWSDIDGSIFEVSGNEVGLKLTTDALKAKYKPENVYAVKLTWTSTDTSTDVDSVKNIYRIVDGIYITKGKTENVLKIEGHVDNSSSSASGFALTTPLNIYYSNGSNVTGWLFQTALASDLTANNIQFAFKS